MTRFDTRGTHSRSRKRRSTFGDITRYELRLWELLVESIENGATSHLTGCDECDQHTGLEARDMLESTVLRGGRRSERLKLALAPLDARFLRAISPNPCAARGTRWWWARLLD